MMHSNLIVLLFVAVSLLQTGNSKGYAFVEFESKDVAKIVAETMNNYLFGERLLECKCSCLTAGLPGCLLLVGDCGGKGGLPSCLDMPLHLWDESYRMVQGFQCMLQADSNWNFKISQPESCFYPKWNWTSYLGDTWEEQLTHPYGL